MGIVKAGLIVLAMVSRPRPSVSDELGAKRCICGGASAVFYLVASDYFSGAAQGYVEFWKTFRGMRSANPEDRQASRSARN